MALFALPILSLILITGLLVVVSLTSEEKCASDSPVVMQRRLKPEQS